MALLSVSESATATFSAPLASFGAVHAAMTTVAAGSQKIQFRLRDQVVFGVGEGRFGHKFAHGNKGDGDSLTALLVVDMLTPYDHPDADRLAASAKEAPPGDRTPDRSSTVPPTPSRTSTSIWPVRRSK